MRGLPNTLALALALTLPGCDRVFGVDPSVDGGDGDGGVPDAACRDQCGDGCVTAPEQCDDGNTDDHDGCSSICQVEVLTWSQPQGTAVPAARHRAGLALDTRNNTLLLLGGVTEAGTVADGWRWGGSTWAMVPMLDLPEVHGGGNTLAAGSASTLVYFADSSPVVAIWDGTQWNTGNPFAPRTGHGVATAPAGKVVIFGGGVTPASVGNETALVFDGVSVVDAPGGAPWPQGRRLAALGYAPDLGGTILFGGLNAGTLPTDDTWRFDGLTWIEVDVADTPPARWGAATAWDPHGQRLLLFGGASDTNAASANCFGDLWAFDGTTWTRLSPPGPGPSARTSAALAWHPPTSTFVLFGGVASGIASDETWLLRYE
jgi:cysteine-rich repeat protein